MLMKTQTSGPHPQVSDPKDLVWGLTPCIPSEFAGDAAGPRPTL